MVNTKGEEWIKINNKGGSVEDFLKSPTSAFKPIFNLFEIFEGIQYIRNDVKIVEISLRQGQIVLIFEKDLIPLDAFYDLALMVQKMGGEIPPFLAYSSIGFIGENPAMIINTDLFKKEQGEFSAIFKILNSVIQYAANTVCKCPALEIVFSGQYIKCYLDKPGITVEDVQKYEQMFNLKGTLELFGQRPYLLLINDTFEE